MKIRSEKMMSYKERTRLSKNLMYGTYITLLISVFFGYLIYLHQNQQDRVVVYSIFIAVFVILAFFFSSAKTVEFDSDHLYIIKGNTSEIIPLSDVKAINLSIVKINLNHTWMIEYLDANNSLKSVRVLPKDGKIEVFKTFVLSRNPKVQNQKL